MAEHLYKRGDVYWCWFYIGKRRVQRSTHCTDRSAARNKLRDFERNPKAATAHRAAANAGPDTELGEVLRVLVEHGGQDVSPGTRNMRATKAGHLARLLGNHDVNLLSMDDVQGYIEGREGEGAARLTIRKELSTLRIALEHAMSRGIRARELPIPIPKFRAKYIPRKRHLSHEEFRQLLPHMAVVRINRDTGRPYENELELLHRRQLWLFLACFTGGRDSELARVAWEDIAPDWTGLTLPGTKTARARRWIPMHPALRRELKKAGQGKGPIVGRWLNVLKGLAAACRRAGIERVTPNDLRRTFASWMVQAGAPLKAVAELMGHTTTQMVDLVYGHLNDAARANAVKLLPDFGRYTGVTVTGRKSEKPTKHSRKRGAR